MSHEVVVLDNVCEGCSAGRALLGQRDRAESSITCEADRASYTTAYEAKLAKLDESAGRIGCKHLDKDLPEASEPVPPVGLEWREFAERCPAFREIN